MLVVSCILSSNVMHFNLRPLSKEKAVMHKLTFIMCLFNLLTPFAVTQCMKTHFLIHDISCICHALQFDTIQAMLWCMTQYDLIFVLGLLWPWPLTYIDIFWLGYGARNLAIDIYNHNLVSDIQKALFVDALIAMTIT